MERTELDTLKLNGKHTALAYRFVEAQTSTSLPLESSLCVCTSSNVVIIYGQHAIELTTGSPPGFL